MATLDINDLTAILAQSSGKIDQTKSAMQDQGAQQQQAITDQGTATAANIQALGTGQVRQEQGQATAQAQTQSAATSLGTNMGDASEVLSMLSKNLRANVLASSMQNAKVTNIEANSDLFSNPAGFLRDLLYGDGERSKAKALNDAVKEDATNIQTLTTTTQGIAASNNAIAVTHDQGTVLGVQQAVQAKADAAIAESRKNLAGVNIDLLGKINTLDSQQSGLAVQVFNAQAADDQRKFNNSMRVQQAEAMALQRVVTNENLRQLQEQRQAKMDQAATDQSMLDSRNRAAVKLGKPIVSTLQGWKSMMQVDKDGEAFLMNQGAYLDQGGKSLIYGSTPVDALKNVQNLQIQLPVAQTQLAKSIFAAMPGATSMENMKTMFPEVKNSAELMALAADKKQTPNLQARFVDMQAKAMESNIPNGATSQTNWYAPASLGTVIDNPNMMKNDFIRQQLAPIVAASPTTQFDTGLMLNQAQTAIGKGTSMDTIVEGIQLMATQLVNKNNMVNNYQGFGLKPQSSLKMPLSAQANTIWGNNFHAVVDWTDKAQIAKALNLAITTQAQRTSGLNGIVKIDPEGINSFSGL